MKPTYQNAIFTISTILFSVGFNFAQITYESYHPCSFEIKLPTTFIFENVFEEDDNLDVCNYNVKWQSDKVVLQVNSLNASRFEYSTILELYNAAVASKKLNISYKIQKKNWFVISGTNAENKNIVYWKRVLGGNFVSDLYIEYPSANKDLIEPYIATMSKSFDSD